MIKGYQKWWGRKNLEWFNPPSTTWSAYKVDVRVNPELGLRINGVPHLIKLYHKSDRIAKSRVDLITHLMKISLSYKAPKNTIMSVLDVRRSNLMSPTVPIDGLTAALEAELAYIAALWPNV